MILASNLFEQILGTKLLAQAESMGVRANHIEILKKFGNFYTSGYDILYR